jgi:hypothetical protein
VGDDIRLVNDVRKEKLDAHPAKVVDRRWFERQKHIFPYSRCVYTYIYMYACMHASLYFGIASIHSSPLHCLYVYTHTYTYVHIYIYTYLSLLRWEVFDGSKEAEAERRKKGYSIHGDEVHA